MTRFRAIIVAAVFAFFLGAASAQVTNTIYLPFVANGQPPTAVKLLEGDYTLVSVAESPDGCVFGAIMDRGEGNFIHVGQIVGDTFVEVELPEYAPPSFVPEGEKHAGMDLLIHDGLLKLFYTTRPPGAESGGFDLWRMTMPLPGCL